MTLKFLALQGAPYIYDINRLRVKQRLKCSTGKVCNCLIQFFLTMVLSIEERVFLVEYVFRKGSRYTDLLQEQFAERFPEPPVHHRSAVRRLIEKFRETGLVLHATRSGRPFNVTIRSLWTFLSPCCE
jgi:hypothetical protein